MNRVWFLLVVMLAACPVLGNEQPATDEDRSIIGVALGGGGARGMAHIGVLQRLDELRVPVDRICGTSMGAVVGVLFSLGFTPEEIEATVLAVDWRSLMTDRPDRLQMSYRRKTDYMENIWPIEIGVTGDGLVLQRGMIMGQKFNFIFEDPGLYTAGYDSFDSLPVPFRPVATDLETGEVVILDRGNLLQAVRASMAAPGAFPPVLIGDRLLVDGYLRTMVPVDAAREMGADKVIAVHVGWAPGDTPDGSRWGLPEILLQANLILTYSNVLPQLDVADVGVLVSLPDVPLFDLTQAKEVIAAGRAAVDNHLEELLPLALSEAEYARWRESIHSWIPVSPVIAAVEVENRTMVSDRTITERITQADGDTLDLGRLKNDLGRVYQLGVFESVDFSLEGSGPSKDLVIQPTGKPYLPWIMRFGASYRINLQNRGEIQFLTHLIRYEFNSLGGELRTDLALGALMGVAGEFYQPLEYSRTLFIAPALFYQSRITSVFDGSYLVGEYQTRDWGGHIDLGVNLGSLAEIRAGYWLGRTETGVDSGGLDFPLQGEDIGALKFGIGFDLLDRHSIPKRGFAGSVQAWLARPGLGDDLDFERYWGHLVGAATRGDWTLQYRVQAGSSEGDLPFYRQFQMGGLRDLTGIANNSLRGRAFGMAGAGLLYHLSGMNLPFATQWYLGGWVDTGNTWEYPEYARLDDFKLGGALTLLMDTAFGPIETGYGRSDNGHDTIYLQAGIHFAMPSNR
ncbi:MAG: patatin-like phospholipase family protein [Candidatus Krumholzibacteria bacterium]|nr:patatin-like phospholipase family protein [Candidatus Krumholzibacteria bacterium]